MDSRGMSSLLLPTLIVLISTAVSGDLQSEVSQSHKQGMLPLPGSAGLHNVSSDHSVILDDFGVIDPGRNEALGNVSDEGDEYGADVLHQCDAFKETFSNRSAEFIKCSVDNARPLRLCIRCVRQYELTMEVYDYFKNVSSPCHNELLKSDRVQVLPMIYNNIIAIWTKAYCNNCFSSVEVNGTSGTVTYNLSQSTAQLMDLYNDTKTCFERNNETSQSGVPPWNTTLCRECRNNYKDLNNNFEATMKQTNGKVCMDLVDMMNETRKLWGGEYHCTHSIMQYGQVIAVGVCMLLTPVALYGGSKLFGARAKRHIMKQKRLRVQGQDSFYGSVNLSHSLGHSLGHNGVESRARATPLVHPVE